MARHRRKRIPKPLYTKGSRDWLALLLYFNLTTSTPRKVRFGMSSKE